MNQRTRSLATLREDKDRKILLVMGSTHTLQRYIATVLKPGSYGDFSINALHSLKISCPTRRGDCGYARESAVLMAHFGAPLFR